jgi:hypothetical protein
MEKQNEENPLEMLHCGLGRTEKLANGYKWTPNGMDNLWSFGWFEKQIIKF